MAQCGKRELLAIGRLLWCLNEPRTDGTGFLLDRHPGQRAQRNVNCRGERNLRWCAAIHRNALQLAFAAQNQRAAVGSESVTRHQVLPALRLDLVVLNGKGQPTVRARLELTDPQSRLPLEAGRIRQPLAIGRESRPEVGDRERSLTRPAWLRKQGLLLTRADIAAHDRPVVNAAVEIRGTVAPGKVELPAIGRYNRAKAADTARPCLPCTPDRNHESLCAVKVIAPELVVVDRPRKPADIHGLAVRAPGR